MDIGAVSEEDLSAMPCLAAGCDPTRLRLNAAEGYLLSRIDGQTPWRMLREIGGMSPGEVDIRLEEWLDQGVIEMGRRQAPKAPPQVPQKPKPRRAPEPTGTPGQIDLSQIDEALDLSADEQRRILDVESRLGVAYHDLLEVAYDANAKQVKKAYFKLSREFHPDRFFRKEIGGYQQRLERIFKKITEAYELLSDPATRAEVQKSMATQGPPPPVSPAQPMRSLSPIERLRRRMPFKIPEALLAERRHKARAFHDAAIGYREHERLLEAASSIRLAIAFDPHEERYKETFAEIQSAIADERIAELLEAAKGWTDKEEFREGLPACEEALLYRPHHPELNHTAAWLCLRLGDAAQAREYIDAALEHSPEVGVYHRTLAETLVALGDKGHGLRAAEKALQLDPHDEAAKRLLDSLKKRPRPAVRGGRA